MGRHFNPQSEISNPQFLHVVFLAVLPEAVQVFLEQMRFVLEQRAFDVVAVDAAVGLLDPVGGGLDLLGPFHHGPPALFGKIEGVHILGRFLRFGHGLFPFLLSLGYLLIAAGKRKHFGGE